MARANSPRHPAVLALALSIAVLSGCASATTPAPTLTNPAPLPSSTPMFSSDAEALAAAKASYERFLEVDDAISQDGGRDPQRLDAVELDPSLTIDKRGYEELSSSGKKVVGKSRIAGFKLQSASANGEVNAYVCLDDTAVGIVDANGSTNYPNAKNVRQTFVVTFVPKDRQLYPSKREPWGKASPCDS